MYLKGARRIHSPWLRYRTCCHDLITEVPDTNLYKCILMYDLMYLNGTHHDTITIHLRYMQDTYKILFNFMIHHDQ